MRALQRPHYAWLVCLGGALSLSTVMGLGSNVFSIYQPEILAFHQFTNAQGSWITTTRSLFVLLALLTVNQLCNRLGLRVVMMLGNLSTGLSCFCFALSRTFPMYLFSAALAGLGYCLGGMVPLSLLISGWFRERRGLALGIASAGSGISTIIAPPAITKLIRTQGLHFAFAWEGGFILICTLLIWLLVRSRPEDISLEPYGSTLSASAVSPKNHTDHPRAQKLLLLAGVLLGGPFGPAFTHLAVYYTSEGFDSGFVALLISLMGAAICLGKILCGQIYDRMGVRAGNHFAFSTYLLGLFLCCLAPTQSVIIAVAAIFLFSLGLSTCVVPPAVWAHDLASKKNYAGLIRSFTLSYTVGMLVFGPVPGILADLMGGSYLPAYVLFTAFLLIAYLIVLGIYSSLNAGRA